MESLGISVVILVVFFLFFLIIKKQDDNKDELKRKIQHYQKHSSKFLSRYGSVSKLKSPLYENEVKRIIAEIDVDKEEQANILESINSERAWNYKHQKRNIEINDFAFKYLDLIIELRKIGNFELSKVQELVKEYDNSIQRNEADIIIKQMRDYAIIIRNADKSMYAINWTLVISHPYSIDEKGRPVVYRMEFVK